MVYCPWAEPAMSRRYVTPLEAISDVIKKGMRNKSTLRLFAAALRVVVKQQGVIERMSANLRQFPVVHKNIRRALLRRFPYALMFVIDGDTMLTVTACFHGSRDPAHWQERT
jgi:hypothetical protein